MIYIVQNALQILAATAAGMAFGGVYFAQVGSPSASVGPLRYSPAFIVTAFLGEFWLAAILAGAVLLAPTAAGAWTMALGSAVVIWIGFVVPVLVVTHRFRDMPWRTVLIDCGHWLGVMVLQAAVLRAIGLTLPTG